MDNIMELAMQIILCLLVAALIGGIIGYLLGKISKCDNDDEYDKKDKLNDYSQDFMKEDTTLDENNLGDINKNISTTSAGIGAVSSSVFATDDETVHNAIGQEIGVRPSSLQTPINGKADDLKEISGIGLKIEDTLQGLGIFNFQQIAGWSSDNVDWIENYLTFKGRVKKEDWIGQAKLLSAGGQTEFSKKIRRSDNH